MERHQFVQLVLPLHGKIELDIEGRGAVIGPDLAAVVGVNTRHTQRAVTQHQALILDVDAVLISDCDLDQSIDHPYVSRSQQNIEMARLLARAVDTGRCENIKIEHALSLCLAQTVSPLDALLALREIVELAPLSAINAVEMSRLCGLKNSQFHDVFRKHFGTTPHQWLVGYRLNAVKQMLENTDVSLSTLAQSAGYSDQSALTRAFRNHFGVALREYRRSSRH